MLFQDFGIDVGGQTGDQIRTTCPQCSPGRKKSKEKCLAVNTNDGLWFCHHCGYNGSLTAKDLKTFSIPEKEHNLPDKMIKWFESRGISKETVTRERIAYEKIKFKDGEDRRCIKFPYYFKSLCVNIKYRTNKKEFWQKKGGLKCLYRHDAAVKSGKDTLVIVEGEMDCLCVLEAGYESVSIPDGAPNPEAKAFHSKFDFLKNTEKLFEKFDKIIIATDGDDPGKKAASELARRIGYEKSYVLKYPDAKTKDGNPIEDPNEIAVHLGYAELRRLIENAEPYPVEGIVSVTDNMKDVWKYYNEGVEQGFSTGWDELDKCYTVRPGELTILTGYPSSGKSNFIDALTVNLIENHRWRIAYCSPENWPPHRHTRSLMEKLVKKSFFKTSYGQRMNEEDITDAMNYLQDHVRYIIPKHESISIENILKYTRLLCLQFGIKGLVIDPWNEMEHKMKPGEREDLYISRQLSDIRRFARFNGIHIWVIAHPSKPYQKNKDGGDDPPQLYDISGGANWRNKADNGITVHRDFNTNLVSVITRKVRFREVGQIGETYFRFDYSSNYKSIKDEPAQRNFYD